MINLLGIDLGIRVRFVASLEVNKKRITKAAFAKNILEDTV